jgi:hypothetical protein
MFVPDASAMRTYLDGGVGRPVIEDVGLRIAVLEQDDGEEVVIPPFGRAQLLRPRLPKAEFGLLAVKLDIEPPVLLLGNTCCRQRGAEGGSRQGKRCHLASDPGEGESGLGQQANLPWNLDWNLGIAR